MALHPRFCLVAGHRPRLFRRCPRALEIGEDGDEGRRSISPVTAAIPMRISVCTEDMRALQWTPARLQRLVGVSSRPDQPKRQRHLDARRPRSYQMWSMPRKTSAAHQKQEDSGMETGKAKRTSVWASPCASAHMVYSNRELSVA